MTFGYWLENRIIELNMKPTNLAFELDVSRGAVSLWISGGRHPNKKMQKRIVDFLAYGDLNKRNQFIIEIFDLIP